MRPIRGLARTLMGLAGTLLAPAVDPRTASVDEAGREQELIERVRLARMRVHSAQQRIERQLELAAASLAQLDGQARQALVAGRDDLARLALQQRRAADAERQSLAMHWQAVGSEYQRLALIEQQLVARLDAWTARREILAARLTAAELQTGIDESLSDAAQHLTGADTAFVQTEEALQYLQARATAIDHLTQIGVLDPLDSHPLLADDPEIEVELAALRATIAE